MFAAGLPDDARLVRHAGTVRRDAACRRVVAHRRSSDPSSLATMDERGYCRIVRRFKDMSSAAARMLVPPRSTRSSTTIRLSARSRSSAYPTNTGASWSGRSSDRAMLSAADCHRAALSLCSSVS